MTARQETERKRTIAEHVAELAGPGVLTHAEVAAVVRMRVEGAQTTAASVSSILSRSRPEAERRAFSRAKPAEGARAADA